MLHSFHLFTDSIEYTKQTGKKKWQIKAEVRIIDKYVWLYGEGKTKEAAMLDLISWLQNQLFVRYNEKFPLRDIEEVA